MTIRRLNFTRRRKIPRTQVSITLRESDDGTVRYEAEFSFEDAFPPDAAVFVEAHRQSRWQRFDHGSVASPGPPDSTVLRDFVPGEEPLFRVKVVEPAADGHGRLIGVADNLRPEESGPGRRPRVSLMPVEPSALGSIPWRLDLEEAPVLQINQDVGDWREVATSAEYAWLVYPEVVRRVLTRVIFELETTEAEDLSQWPDRWVYFALSLPGVGPLPQDDPDRQQEWIDDVVEQFCRANDLKRRGRQVFARENGGS